MKLITDADKLAEFLLLIRNRHSVQLYAQTNKNYFVELEQFYRDKNASHQLHFDMAKWTGIAKDN